MPTNGSFGLKDGQAGPATFQQLATLALNGTLRPDNAVGRVGTNWVPAGAMFTVFSQSAQKSAPSLNDDSEIADAASMLVGIVLG